MVYMLNLHNFFDLRTIVQIFNFTNNLDSSLLLYRSAEKSIGKDFTIKNKFGFNRLEKFDMTRIKQNLVINFNTDIYEFGNIVELIDYCANQNKILILVLSKDKRPNFYQEVKEYLQDKYSYEEIDRGSEINSYMKSLRRQVLIKKLLS